MATTNYNLHKPVRGEADWGGKLNENFDTIDGELKSHDVQLAEKANQADLDTTNSTIDLKADKTELQSIASGSPKGTYNDLTSLQTAYPTGSTGIYIVVADGHWYYWNGSAWTSGGVYQSTGIADGSITPVKTSFFKVGKNLFNKLTITAGKYLNSSTGLPTTNNASYYTSDFIPVLPNTNYYFYGAESIVAYDASKQFISTINGTQPRTTPSNCYYVRYSGTNTLLDTAQVELGDIKTAYEAYQLVLDTSIIKDSSIDGNKLKVNNTDGVKIKDNSLPYNKTDCIITGKNLFNKDDVFTGYLSGGNVVGSASKTSNYIAISPNTTYVTSGDTSNCQVAFYDVNKNYINSLAYGRTASFTTPSNAYYLKTTVEKSDYSLYQLELGATPTTFESFGYKLKNQILSDTYLLSKNNFKGLKLCVYGDSITASNLWATDVKNEFGFSTLYNRGWSDSAVTMENKTLYINADGTYNSNPLTTTPQPVGTTEVQCSFCHADRIAYIPTDTDIVLIMGGTNDFLRHQPIGALSYPYDENTFVGALASTHKKIQERLPNATIVLMTQIQTATAIGTPTPRVNYDGLTVIDYVKAIRNVADYVGCPLIDVYRMSGINLHNTVQTSSDGVHPTVAGHKLISKAVIGGLKQLMPIS